MASGQASVNANRNVFTGAATFLLSEDSEAKSGEIRMIAFVR
jgi:hypothetical protein